MNHINRKPFAVLLLLAAFVYTACSTAGSVQGSEVNIDSLLQTRRFVFIPQSVNPTGGRTQQITPDFFMRVGPDTVQSYLPYYGRAYTAPINSGRGPMDFILTNFEYLATTGKKNRKQITIRPASAGDIRELVLQVSPNGYATLIALSNNRQQISYNGYIQSRLR